MAKVYAVPDGINVPVPNYSNYQHRKEQAKEEKFIAELKAWCIKNGNGVLAGEIVSWGVADGQAQYMVVSEKPLHLIHLPLGDKYSAGAIWERGLRLADVRQLVGRSKGLAKLFAEADE